LLYDLEYCPKKRAIFQQDYSGDGSPFIISVKSKCNEPYGCSGKEKATLLLPWQYFVVLVLPMIWVSVVAQALAHPQ
jgi:hypothetical protein